MLTIILIFIASSFASLANFFIRKNLELKGSTKGYFISAYACSLTISIIFNPQIVSTAFSPAMLLTGSVAGCLIVTLMGLTALTLTKGPAGLTFAFQTSGSVFPIMILFLLFGSAFGFFLNLWILIGLALVIIGLFWAAKPSGEDHHFKKGWLRYALSIFILHALLLALIQWRCLFFTDVPFSPLIPFHCKASQDVWFMPGMFGMALVLQSLITIGSGHWPTFKELKYGLLGGISNGTSTYFLLLATTLASSLEKGILFPTFTVGIMMICNLWSSIFYSEKVNWRANFICSIGILIASI